MVNVLNVEVALKPYKIDDKERDAGDDVALKVRPQWNNKDIVEMQFADGPKFTISAAELSRALRACSA